MRLSALYFNMSNLSVRVKVTERVTYINVQDLIGGPFSQKGLPGRATDFVGSAVCEHGPPSLVLPRSVNSPVSINDGSAWPASESWKRHREQPHNHHWQLWAGTKREILPPLHPHNYCLMWSHLSLMRTALHWHRLPPPSRKKKERKKTVITANGINALTCTFKANVFHKRADLFVLADLSCKSCNRISQEVFHWFHGLSTGGH